MPKKTRKQKQATDARRVVSSSAPEVSYEFRAHSVSSAPAREQAPSVMFVAIKHDLVKTVIASAIFVVAIVIISQLL